MSGNTTRNLGATKRNYNCNDSGNFPPFVNPLQSIMSGSANFAKQLNDTANTKEEFTTRSKAIRPDVSKPAQAKMRAVIKTDTNAHTNAVGKIVEDHVLKSRKKQNAKDIEQGKMLPDRRTDAQKTNTKFNRAGKITKIGGRVLGAATIASEAYNVATAPEGKRFKEATRAGGRLGGGFAAGAATGAALGAIGCNPVTTFIGGLIGGAIGSMGGESAVDSVWNHIEKR